MPYVTDNQNPVAPEHGYIINKIAGDPTTDEEAIAILDRLLQHAFYLSYDVLSFDTMYVYDAGKEKSDDEGRAYGPVNANVCPYNNLADLQADMANTFTDDVYTDTQMRALKDPKYYKDFDGKLYCLKGVSGVSMARSWDVEGVQTLTITENKIMAEMPVERLETFSATLEAVKVDGVWVLNKSYFADPQDSN